MCLELTGCGFIHRYDSLAMAGAVLIDMIKGLLK